MYSAGDAVNASDGADNGGSDLAARLNTLFEALRKASGSQLSNAAAAEAITKKTGVKISPAYMWQLRSGLKTNPTVQHLCAIADFFGVPPSYLIERSHDSDTVEEQLTLLHALRDSGIRDIAMRLSGVTPEAITSLATMVDEVRKLQDLPPMAREG